MENNKFEVTVNKFTEEAANKFAKDVADAASLDTNHPITINIDSYGGQVYSLINMIETMRSVPNPFITVCKGKAMSCGALLLAMGDQRFCGKDSSVMIHEVSSGVIGNVDDMKVETKEVERLNIQMMTLLAEKMNMTFQKLKDLINVDGRRELYLTAEDAKKYGLVHAVGLPLIRPVVSYQIETIPSKTIVVEKAPTVVKKKATKKKVIAKKKTKTVSKKKKSKR